MNAAQEQTISASTICARNTFANDCWPLAAVNTEAISELVRLGISVNAPTSISSVPFRKSANSSTGYPRTNCTAIAVTKIVTIVIETFVSVSSML